MDLDAPCGRHLRLRDLLEAGETWRRLRLANVPERSETFAGLRRLAEELLDPVIDAFGAVEVTYGFASPALTRHISSRIDPRRDQHAGHELGRNGRPVCGRLGQAVDFRVVGTSSARVAAWIAAELPFDRLYFYGTDRPLHVSVGPDEARAVVAMLPGPSGRRIPRLRSAAWLAEEAEREPGTA